MSEHILIGLTVILALGIMAQWLAWRLHLPSILLLMIFGIFAGPVTGFLNPDALFGNILLPVVSLSVAIILFEGGLSLRIGELKSIGNVVRNLITIGALATWFLSAGAAYLFLNFSIPLSLLLGAVLVVTGPTVIGPLLSHVRPTARLGSILRWEGILIDPVGAVLALLVFEAIVAGSSRDITHIAAKNFLSTILVGGVFGCFGAWILILFLKKHWVPDFLENPVSLMVVLSVFTGSNLLQHESGLLTVTIMGILMANQKSVVVEHIIEFKENLRVLLIASLFIVLAARLKIEDLVRLGWGSLFFLLTLLFIIRPICIFVSTIGSELRWRERLFLSWLAPRGVVAAAVSSIFASRLAEASQYPNADRLVPVTFMVIIGTVATYSLTASWVARLLGVAQPNPQGAIIIGAHHWSREIAKSLRDEGFQVVLVDTNWNNIYSARMLGLPAYYGNILSKNMLDEIQLEGIGRLFAFTSNHEVNSLAALHCSHLFSRQQVYQLPLQIREKSSKDTVPLHLCGRFLFSPEATYEFLEEQFSAGATLKRTLLTEEFDYRAFQKQYQEQALPLFLISKSGDLNVFSLDKEMSPQPGHILISLVRKQEDKTAKEELNLSS